jgi:hypothetical protein
MDDQIKALRALAPLEIADGTPGVYFALLSTGEVKIGLSTDIRQRLLALVSDLNEPCPPKLLAVAPGARQVETNYQRRFKKDRSRPDPSREIFWPNSAMVGEIHDLRGLDFTLDELTVDAGCSCELTFDDGKKLTLRFTGQQMIEEDRARPRQVTKRVCPRCNQQRNSLEFLTKYRVERPVKTRPRQLYLVLDSGDECYFCVERPLLPAAIAFPDAASTAIRVDRILDRDGLPVVGYDQSTQAWVPLINFGVRFMDRHHKRKVRGGNDHTTLRLQPYSKRKGQPEYTPGLLRLVTSAS